MFEARKETRISDIFSSSKECINICAPMVRYSKLPFRELVRSYGVDVAYTPMTLAADFLLSPNYQAVELQKSCSDSPLVMQMAAKNDLDFGLAAGLIHPFVDALDLNCGCPQRWAVAENIGSSLLDKDPQVVFDMVRSAYRNTPSSFPITIKIRLLPQSMARGSPGDMRKTIEYCLQMQKSGISWLSVHGRTRRQRSDIPADHQAIKEICDIIQEIPVIANGDVFSLDDAIRIQKLTGCRGVMAARGLLENPMLFSGSSAKTTWECMNLFLDRCMKYGMHEALMHNHLIFMSRSNPRLFSSDTERKHFFNLKSTFSVIDFVKDKIPTPN